MMRACLVSICLCAVWCLPRLATACDPLPTDGYGLAGAFSETIAKNGLIAFDARAYGGDVAGAAAAITVEVVRDANPVAGTVEIIDYRPEQGAVARDFMIVWRPAAELEPGEGYTATVTNTLSAWSGESEVTEVPFVVEDATAPALGPVTAGVSDMLETQWVGTGKRVCCETQPDSCGISTRCIDTERRQTVVLRGGAEIDLALAPYVYARVLRGVDGTADEVVDAYPPNYTPTEGFTVGFDQPASEYCMAIEYVDLIDGTVQRSEPACAPHGDLVLEQVEADLESFVDSCIEDPYIEGTEQPYEPGADADEGCGCSSTTAPPAAMAMIVLAGLVCRRRRLAEAR